MPRISVVQLTDGRKALECLVESNPLPQLISWLKNVRALERYTEKEYLTQGEPATKNRTYILDSADLIHDSTNQYSCTATNMAGTLASNMIEILGTGPLKSHGLL